MADLKPYRTWEVRARSGEATPYSKPWYVFEVNPCKGRRSVNLHCYGFETEEAARDYAATLTKRDMEKEGVKAARRAERAAVRKATPNLFKVGMILSNSWGYDQTNVDFYQVTRTTPRGVYIRPIGGKSVPGSEGFMSDKVVPARNQFTGPEQFKPVLTGSDKGYLAADHGVLSLCDEWETHYQSWYA